MYPRLIYHQEKLVENIQKVASRCAQEGITLWGVTKGICAHPDMARLMVEHGCEGLFDSRLQNLVSLKKENLGVPLWLLRIPMPQEIDALVEHAEGAVVSMKGTLALLNEASKKRDKIFECILMMDIGDLREGLWPDEIDDFGRFSTSLSHLRIVGVGANWGCYGGILPTRENEELLISKGRELERQLGYPLRYFSGGNTAALSLMEKEGLPSGINHLRIGEGLLLGTDVTHMRTLPWLCQDTMELQAQVVEVRPKPSVPMGKQGADAFGNVPSFEDKGLRRRAIVALGRQDVSFEGLTPKDRGIVVLGASSDHMILDVEDSPREILLGDILSFTPDYGAMLRTSTSPYVEKVFSR